MLRILSKYWHFALLAILFMICEVTVDMIQPRLMATIVDDGILGLSGNGRPDLQLISSTGVIMLWYSWQLTLLACSTIILSMVFTKILSRLIRKYYVQRQQLLGSINGIVEEKVSSYKTVTAYNQREAAIEDFNKTSDALTKAGITAEIISSSMGPVMNMLNNISFVIVAVFGGYFVIKGTITVGVISAFIIYSKQFSRPINELSQLYGQIQTAMAGAERIFEILDARSEDKSGEVRMSSTEGVIEFRHVNFSYVPGKPVIRDFNLKVEAGKKIALVGSTGSGKTSFASLYSKLSSVISFTTFGQSVGIYIFSRCSFLRISTPFSISSG